MWGTEAPLECRKLLAIDSVWAGSTRVSPTVGPCQLVNTLYVLLPEKRQAQGTVVGQWMHCSWLGSKPFYFTSSPAIVLSFTRSQAASALQIQGKPKTDFCLLRFTHWITWLYFYTWSCHPCCWSENTELVLLLNSMLFAWRPGPSFWEMP